MKKKIEIICFLCLAFGAINIKAQEVEKFGWLNTAGGTYTYSDVASGEGTWGAAAPSGRRVKGCASLENACNGGLLIMPAVRNEDGKNVYVALN